MIEAPRTFVLTVNRPIKCFDQTAEHLNSIGFKWERFDGVDNQKCHLNPIETFDIDRVGERIASKHICATLSHYLLWKTMLYQPEDMFWVLEYDVRLEQDWKDRYQMTLDVLPTDWDIVFIGSCCCKGRNTTKIGNNLYEVKYPLCGHAMMYNKKALPVLLDIHQKINMPLDIALYYMSLPKLKVYTVLPPIVYQAGPSIATVKKKTKKPKPWIRKIGKHKWEVGFQGKDQWKQINKEFLWRYKRDMMP